MIELLANEATTVLFSSHHLQEVERIATRIGILHEGRMLMEEEVDRLREGSCQVLVKANGVTAESLSRSISNCVKATPQESGLRLTLLLSEAEARELLSQEPNIEVKETRALSLEDLFIALVGDNS